MVGSKSKERTVWVRDDGVIYPPRKNSPMPRGFSVATMKEDGTLKYADVLRTTTPPKVEPPRGAGSAKKTQGGEKLAPPSGNEDTTAKIAEKSAEEARTRGALARKKAPTPKRKAAPRNQRKQKASKKDPVSVGGTEFAPLPDGS